MKVLVYPAVTERTSVIFGKMQAYVEAVKRGCPFKITKFNIKQVTNIDIMFFMRNLKYFKIILVDYN